MLMPYRTLPDPEVQGGGSLDPLGLAGARRPLGRVDPASRVVRPFEDEVARDGVSPPWLVLEGYCVEALARIGCGGETDLRRVPGIGVVIVSHLRHEAHGPGH